MATPTARKAKREIHGASRRPEPIGIEFEDLYGPHDVWEFSEYRLDPTLTDWIEVLSETGKPQRVYYRGAMVDYIQPDAELKIDFSIQEVPREANDQNRGSTLSRLYLEFGIFEQKRGRFVACVSKATMVSVISLGRRSEYPRLVKFNPKYEEFLGLIASTGSRNAAFREFTSRYAPPTENHASTLFEGKRGKTVEHDCLVMIAIYEAFALSREEARAAGNMKPLANLYELLDYLTLELMSNIGEPIGTWGE